MNDSDTVFTEDGSVIDPVFIKDARVFDGYQMALEFDHATDYSFT